MRLTSLVAAVTLAALIVRTVTADAPIGADGPNGFRLELTARFAPGSGDDLPSAAGGTDAGRLHRFVLDRDQRRYFAYDLAMAASGADGLRVAVEPLSLSKDKVATLPFLEGTWTAMPFAKPPAPQEIKDGDRLVVSLFQEPADGKRLLDTIVFTRPGNR